MMRGMAGKLPGNFKDKLVDNQIKLDTEKLVDRFLAQNKLSLFEFLLQYKFPKAIGEVKLEDRMSLFVEIAMEYEKTLDFKYRLNWYEYQDDNGKNRRIGYTVILPVLEEKKKEKKKAA
jgi:hypothetical protein